MEKIYFTEITKAVDEARCPEPTMCPMAMAAYTDNYNRCVSCWIDYMKKHNIEIIYEEN